MQSGELFIISAPSGTGKTTLIQRILHLDTKFDKIAFSVSHTTRRPRGGEIDGTDYHFVEHPTFERMIADGQFLEWERVHRNFYGTSLGEVIPRLEQGIDVILDIDVQGADRVRKEYPRAHSIFILPPSYEELERRLRHRGDDEKDIARRLTVSREEVEHCSEYDYVIVSDDAHWASQALIGIILEKRHRRERMLGRVQEILKNFRNGLPSEAAPRRAAEESSGNG
jgi:guanylate kinase